MYVFVSQFIKLIAHKSNNNRKLLALNRLSVELGAEDSFTLYFHVNPALFICVFIPFGRAETAVLTKISQTKRFVFFRI
jgi:hypothetical protein